MAIVYDKLLALKIPDVERSYAERDPIFYALSLGLGQDPVNADELPFVYEESTKVLPTFPVVAAQPGFWARELDTGIDWVKVVHGEHDLVLHGPMPARGTSGHRDYSGPPRACNKRALLSSPTSTAPPTSTSIR